MGARKEEAEKILQEMAYHIPYVAKYAEAWA